MSLTVFQEAAHQLTERFKNYDRTIEVLEKDHFIMKRHFKGDAGPTYYQVDYQEQLSAFATKAAGFPIAVAHANGWGTEHYHFFTYEHDVVYDFDVRIEEANEIRIGYREIKDYEYRYHDEPKEYKNIKNLQRTEQAMMETLEEINAFRLALVTGTLDIQIGYSLKNLQRRGEKHE